MAMRRWVAALLCSAWLACGGALAASTVRFEADLSAEIGAGRFDPQRDGVGLRGGFAPLVWDRGLPMQAIGHGRYALTVRFDAAPPAGQPIQHKFRIERPGLGADEGWEPGRNHALVLREGEQTVARQFGAAPADVVLQRTGQIDPLGTVPSRWVAPRGVQVWLPPGYAADAERRHPVLYLHDGQNVFDAAAASAEWGVDETAQRLAQAGVRLVLHDLAKAEQRLADQRFHVGHVRHHQEADRIHAQLAAEANVLFGHVGFGAVRGDVDAARAAVRRHAQFVERTDPRHVQHRYHRVFHP